MRYPGVVKRLTDKGFGFLSVPNRRQDVFFHSNSLIDMIFDELREGDAVGFTLVEHPEKKGSFFAEEVSRDGPREDEWPAELRSREEELEDSSEENSESIVVAGMRCFSQWIISEIARNPNELYEVEWRTLEHVIAEIFDGLGFAVTLTEASKDGGKDLILECEIGGCPASYVVEIKHWNSGKRVGAGMLQRFLQVVVSERRSGGLFLSTSGFSGNAFEQFTVFERRTVRFGNDEKIVGLCQTFERMKSGIMSAPKESVEIINDQTI
jgi:cold shock CspA family protein